MTAAVPTWFTSTPSTPSTVWFDHKTALMRVGHDGHCKDCGVECVERLCFWCAELQSVSTANHAARERQQQESSERITGFAFTIFGIYICALLVVELVTLR